MAEPRPKSHDEMVASHAVGHRSVNLSGFASIEKYVLSLFHRLPYVRALPLARGRRVLDLGCNNGYGSQMLSFVAASVAGCDVSERLIAQANALVTPRPIDFRVADGADLPFADDAFDLIICAQVIEHVVARDRLLAEMRRVLAPGGVAVLTTPNACIRLEPGKRPWNRFHVIEFPPREFAAELAPWFAAVEVLGLRASPEIEEVERTRVALRRSGHVGQVVEGGDSTDDLDQFMERNRIDSMRYVTTDLDESLDQLAVCSEDASACRNALRLMCGIEVAE